MTRTAEPLASRGRAAVIDDHPLVGRGLAHSLTSHCRFAEADIFVSPAEFLAQPLIVRAGFSLIVVDFWIDRQAASGLIKQLVILHPNTRLLVISADASAQIQGHAQSCGAHGFIGKHATPQEFNTLVDAVMLRSAPFCVVGNQVRAPSSLQSQLIDHYRLTERQSQVMMLALRGWTNKRIAESLGTTEQTTKDHMSVVLSKLGVGNRVEAIALLSKQRL